MRTSKSTDNELPMVSVVIPTNNRKQWVTEAIDSVFAQTFSDYEVIVVDDGSEDGTSDHLENRYGDRIKLLRSEASNCPKATNYGLSSARGKYIALLDDDDLWHKEKLEKQVAYLEAMPESVAMVGSGCDHMDAEGNPIWSDNIPPSRLTYQVACVAPTLPGAKSGTLIRRSVLDKVGHFDPALTRNQDRDLWIRITRKYEVHLMSEVLSTVRIHQKPRRGVTVDLIRDCRLEINRKIPEFWIRRQANSWTFFQLFNLYWESRKWMALACLGKSFFYYPVPLPVETNRIKAAARTVVGR